MKNLWLIPGANMEAYRNLPKTMAKPISEERLQKAGLDEAGSKYYAWGNRKGKNEVNVGKWQNMQPDDVCLFYTQDLSVGERAYHWVAKIVDTERSPKLSSAFWDDSEFELVYFLDKPREINISVQSLSKAFSQYRDNYFQRAPLGFTRVDPDVVNKIIAEHKSIESWIENIIAPKENNRFDFINIMQRYKDESIIFQSSVQGARYYVSDVDESGCTIERLDAKAPERITLDTYNKKIEKVRNNGGRYKFNEDFDGTAAVRTTVLQGCPFGLTPDKKTILDLSDNSKACDAFCNILTNLRVHTSSGEPTLYKPAMLSCIIDAMATGELTENKIEFDWITPRFIEKMKNLGVIATAENSAMPFYHLTNDLFWMLCYPSTDKLIEDTPSPSTIRDRVNYATIKDTYWNLLEKPHFREKIKSAIENKWWPAEISKVQPTEFEKYIRGIYNYITNKGFIFSEYDIQNFYACLRSKPFILLAGISGTGKSRLARLFAESVGATSDNGQFELIPVRPDWNDNSDLIGYFDLNNNFQPGRLIPILLRAWGNPEKPCFVCLDEMNLARVEHYFSDFLSIIESRHLDDAGKVMTDIILDEKQLQNLNINAFNNDIIDIVERIKSESPEGICLPSNMYIIGTVNMDETTYPFSRKVLDRANTIEFDVNRLTSGMKLPDDAAIEKIQVDSSFFIAEYITMQDLLKKSSSIAHSVTEKLESINDILRAASCQIGYRIRDEASFYMEYALAAGMNEGLAEEYILLQKIVPRIQGSTSRIEKVLKELLVLYSPEAESIDNNDPGYIDKLIDISREGSALVTKLCQMLIRYHEDGFTSFWT